MARSPSPDPLSGDELALLVDIADDAVAAALSRRPWDPLDLDAVPPALRARRGAFATLMVGGALNGCIGDVTGREPLAHAVARLAVAAAFDDPRLPALRPVQYPDLTVEVSVLSPMTALDAADRAELVARLRPGVDGLAIRSGRRSGLFLPDVWAQLPEPDDFLDQLWRKAGIEAWVWPDSIEWFTTQRLTRRAGHSGAAPGRRTTPSTPAARD